jgi:hypothetical protein
MASDQQRRWSLAVRVPAGSDASRSEMRWIGSETSASSYQRDQHVCSSADRPMVARWGRTAVGDHIPVDTVQRYDGWHLAHRTSRGSRSSDCADTSPGPNNRVSSVGGGVATRSRGLVAYRDGMVRLGRRHSRATPLSSHVPALDHGHQPHGRIGKTAILDLSRRRRLR